MDLPGQDSSFNAPRALVRRRPVGLLLIGLALILITDIGISYFSKHAQTGPQIVRTTSLQALYDQGNFAAVTTTADALVKKDPGHQPYFLALKSEALTQQGNLTFTEASSAPQAMAVAKQAIAAAATSSDAYYALGFADESIRAYGDAHVAYAQAIALNPKDGQALAGNARVYELEGSFAKAKAGYQVAVAADPRAFAAYLGLGRIAASAGATTTATKEFMAAYGSTPNQHERAEVSYYLGMLDLAAGNASSSGSRFDSALSYEKTFAPAYIGDALLHYKDTADAARVESDLSAATAAAIDARNPALHNEMPLALEVVQDKAMALAAVKAVSASVSTGFKGDAQSKASFLAKLDALATLLKPAASTK